MSKFRFMNKHMDKIKFVLVKIFLLINVLNSYSQFVFSDSLSNKEIDLFSYTRIIDLGENNLTSNEVISNFEKYNPRILKNDNEDFGFTKNHFWTQTKIRNNSNTNFKYYLETARPITDVVELFVQNSTSKKIIKSISGDAIPFHKRSFYGKNTVFEINIPKKSELILWLHLNSDGEALKIPVKLYNEKNIIEKSIKEQLFFGFFYGILTIVAIIYFFFFLALKEKIFLYYTFYVISVGLLQFGIDGFLNQFVTHDSGWFGNHAVLIVAIIAVYFSGKYSEEFLKIKLYSKYLYFLFKTAYSSLALLLIIMVLFPKYLVLVYITVNILSLVFLLLVIISIIYLYVKRKPVDVFFSIGISFLIIGFGIFILYNFGLISNTFFTSNSTKFGTGFEIIFLSLSMSNLIRQLKNEKVELSKIALQKSEQMSDLKSYFLSNLSHELRTPLNAIINLTDLIQQETKQDSIKLDCKLIKESSENLLNSIEDIVDFSKIDKKEIILEKNEFNAQESISKLKENFSDLANNKGILFNFSMDDSLPKFWNGDKKRLEQILYNVLSNAIKFSEKGHVDFKITHTFLDEKRFLVQFEISDSGIGISDEKLKYVFDSFSQDSRDDKRKFGGHGLGLYISKNLVDLFNGAIEINSQVDIGTKCVIKIPFESVSNPILKTNSLNKIDFEEISILIVEDNLINQIVLKKIINNWKNTTVIVANNGKEAIEKLQKNNFQIILMDLQMPIMDGYEAISQIRNGVTGEQNKNLPILAITADATNETKKRAFEIGINAYLTKPINKEKLFETFEILIHNPGLVIK
jgi:two-component system, sensor histidine kinase LadS